EGRPPVPLIPSDLDWQRMREQFAVRAASTRPRRPVGIPPSLQVEAVTGTVQTARNGAVAPLSAGQVLQQGQRVQTSMASGMRASYLGEGTIELGAETRATVRKLPTDAANSSTWLRLDDGSALLRWEPLGESPLPLEVSFSRWAAKIDAGEFFIESRADRAIVCRFAGEAVFSGVPATLPTSFGEGCVELTGDAPARAIPVASVAALRDTQGIVKSLRAQLPTPATTTDAGAATAPPPTPAAPQDRP
ncbi:MAG TPA: hypothetical protein VJM11_00655, partial [Nevskiaceae bacterium]|nr:hypothetical protein [Nevskiaceae bacterium]